MKAMIAAVLFSTVSFAHAGLPMLEEPQMSKAPPTELQKAISKLPLATLKKVKAKPAPKPGIEIGMTKKQVIYRSSWGKPETRKTIINEDGQWEFFYYACGTAVLTFLDDELYEIEMEEN